MKKFSPAWWKSFRGRNRPLRVGATLGEATEPSGASAEGLGGGGGESLGTDPPIANKIKGLKGSVPEFRV